MPRLRLKPDPLGVPRSPLAVYLLVLASISGLGLVVGASTAALVETSVPVEVSFTWGLILFLGSLLTLIGMYWQGDIRTGLVLKRLGMFSVGVAAILYGALTAFVLGSPALFSAGTTIGFGVACFAQFHIINKAIHSIITITKSEKAIS